MKTYKPITPSLREKISVIHNLPRTKKLKLLSFGQYNTGFRNNFGRITVRHRGGGHKRNIRLIDLQRINGIFSPIKILRLEYDPNRSSLIALCRTLYDKKLSLKKVQLSIRSSSGFKYFYILATHDMKPGDIINPNTHTSGTAMLLKDINLGSIICNVESIPGDGGKFARSAGTFCTLIKKSDDHVLIKLTSKDIIKLPSLSKATYGRISNIEHTNTILGKAGSNRWLGRRPVVRGEVMNPDSHPMGGKTRGGIPLKNVFGKLAKWVPTRKLKRV